MNDIEVKKWDRGELSYKSILAIYPDKTKFRVRLDKFLPGDGTTSIGREGECYIIDGKCKFKFSSGALFDVSKGDIFCLPQGKHEVSADKNAGVIYATVWDIEKLFKSKST